MKKTKHANGRARTMKKGVGCCKYCYTCNFHNPESTTCKTGGGDYCGNWRRLSDCDNII